MKNRSLLLLALLSVFFAGCGKDDTGSLAEVTNTLSAGVWRVTYFADNGIDKTASFTGYDFVFHSGGNVTATKGSSNEVGTWTPLESDDGSENPDLVISFVTQNIFAEISGKWHILEMTDIKLRMVDDSGSGAPGYLTIEKN